MSTNDPATALADALLTGGPAQAAALAELESGDPAPVTSGDINLDVVLDIPVTLSMEVGRSKLSIRSLLQLNQGSVVELNRATGEPLVSWRRRRGRSGASRASSLPTASSEKQPMKGLS